MTSSLKLLTEKLLVGSVLFATAPGCYADGLALVGNPALSDGFAEEESGGEEDSDSSDSDSSDSDSSSDSSGSDSSGSDSSGSDSDGSDTGEPGAQQAACIPQGLDAPLPCDAQSPSDTFDPVVAWTWDGNDQQNSILVTPLVANFDDDNNDTYVDVCDQPEIAVVAVNLPLDKSAPIPPGTIYLLDSQTGQVERSFADPVDPKATPVVADLDSDGSPELLTLQRGEDFGESSELRRVIAFHGNGEVAWIGESWVATKQAGSLSVADLDADGSPEILAPNHVLNAEGSLLWEPLDNPEGESIPVAVDLDLDGTLEVMFGRSAYDFDGNELFVVDVPGNKSAGIPAIANFDDDPYPELYVQANQHRIFEHDGSLKGTCTNSTKSLPVAIIDADLNGRPDVLLQRGNRLYAYEVGLDGEYEGQGPDNRAINCTLLWDEKLASEARSAGVSFDFLGDGDVEAIHLDASSLKVFSAQGELLAQFDRSARESTALPVVADADNDGAAELLVVASEPEGGDSELEERPALMLIQNADDRFAPTRRVWNQHAYYTTNIREDGSVPSEQQPHWQLNNSFRNNPAPSYDGMLCQGGFE